MKPTEPVEGHLQDECPLHEINNLTEPDGRMFFGGVSTMACASCGLVLTLRFNCGTHEALYGPNVDAWEDYDDYE